MAGNTVRLTFAGDSKDLERALASAGTATERFGDRVDRASGIAVKASAAMAAGVAAASTSAGLVLAALPLAIGGLGIAAAAQADHVKAAFTDLKTHVVAQVKELAKPFEPVLTGIATQARETFDRIAPALGRMFEAAAPLVDKFAGALFALVEGVMPGLEAGVKAAEPAVTALSNGLAAMGPALSGFFTNLAGGAQGGASAVTTLFDAINWLLPVLGTVIGKAAEWSGVLIPLAAAIGGFAILVKAVTAATAAYNAIMVVVRAATAVWTGVQWALNAALSANPIGLVIVAVGALVAAVVYLWNKSEGFRNFFIGAWNHITSFVSGAASRIVGVFRGIGDGIKSAFRAAFNFVASIWNNTVGRISFTVPSWVPGIGGKGFSVPRIPTMHTGGVVPGAPGSEMLALLQAGERVVPADRSGGQGGTEVRFTGNTSDALATVIMHLIRTGKIQIA